MNKDRKALIRLASTMEKGSPERRAILAGLEKTSGGDLLSYLDPGFRKFNYEVAKVVAAKVKSSAHSNELGAGVDPSLLRNNIFKAANSLGIKLPSGMFASDKGASNLADRYLQRTGADAFSKVMAQTARISPPVNYRKMEKLLKQLAEGTSPWYQEDTDDWLALRESIDDWAERYNDAPHVDSEAWFGFVNEMYNMYKLLVVNGEMKWKPRNDPKWKPKPRIKAKGSKLLKLWKSLI